MATSWKGDCVPDLKRERQNCNFDIEELTNIIDGGKENTALRRKLRHVIASDPAYVDAIPPAYMSHKDLYSNALRKSCHTVTKMAELGIIDTRTLLLRKAFIGVFKYGDPLATHSIVFVPVVISQGNAEQSKTWMEHIQRGEIFGTYAQTELGHGTFIRGLETTATYDAATQEFIIHSPTITATKWWSGGMGNTANYAVVMAQLYTHNQCYGPHLFMVKLRDDDTFETLPGITLGEIGSRMGLNSSDNGFLRFNQYRIPRINLLMKHSQVLEDGTYIKSPHSKLSYITMIKTRVGTVGDTCLQLQQAVTIATRYSAVRHQSELVPRDPEPQIFEYQTQQHKIVPQIASVFALLFSARSITETYESIMAEMEGGDLSLLPEIHSLSSGLKALASHDSSSGIEICRLACGGHGYLSSSNLPQLYCGTTCAITYEGENTVLCLQVARYLIKSYRSARQGQIIGPSVSYLLSRPASAHSRDLSDKGLVEAYKTSVYSLVAKTEGRLQKLCDLGQQYHHAWNNCSIMLVKCAEAHIRYYVCEQYLQSVEGTDMSDSLREVLRSLCRLYLIYHITQKPGHFLQCGALTTSDIDLLEEDMYELLAFLRSQAVSIVDAFDFDDNQLNSTLGAWDGNVYQRLYDEAQKSPVNQTDVPEAYYKYLKPLMKKSNLKANL